MKVLGISPLDKDATVVAAQDGELLFAAAEERFSRIKQHAGFPHAALGAALAHTGWRAQDVDAVAYPFLEPAREAALIRQAFDEQAARAARAPAPDPRPALAAAAARPAPTRAAVPGLSRPGQRMEKGWLKRAGYALLGAAPAFSALAARRAERAWAARAIADHARWAAELEAGLARHGLSGRLRRGEHHLAHALSAWLPSGLPRALIVTLDGYGSGLAGSASLVEHGRLSRLAALPFPHSLGSFYELVTSALGYAPDRHAGKIVGLAAYGEAGRLAPVLLGRARQGGGELRLAQPLNPYFARHLAARFAMVDVAAAWQQVLEELAGRFVAHWLAETGAEALCLSGGVVANVKLNQRLAALPGVRRVWVDPGMGDGGSATGLALLLSRGDARAAGATDAARRAREALLTGEALDVGAPGAPLRDVYLGPAYDASACEAALRQAGLPAERPDDLPGAIAARLHAGSVVARFGGRMEYGPRALGNRSILYHGRDPGVNQWLNARLGRTEFMPFAPMTLAEHAAECYLGLSGAEHAARFMTLTFDCTPAMRAWCPAAVHVDGTARPQLVARDTHPEVHEILRRHRALSGSPSLVNTSFNMHEEPIVASPADAIRAFLRGHLDALALGPFLVEQPQRAR